MTWLSRRLVIRALLREWGRALLTLLTVALGVAVFLSIRLANRAAVASFEQFTQGVGQGSDLVLRAEAGPLQEARLPAMRPLMAWGWMRPVIEGSFARKDTLEGFQLMGLDLVGLGAAAPGLPVPPAGRRGAGPIPRDPARPRGPAGPERPAGP